MPYVPPLPAWMPGNEAIEHIRNTERRTQADAIDQLRGAIANRAVGARMLEMPVPEALGFYGQSGPRATPVLSPGLRRQPPPEVWADANIGADGTVAFGPDASRYPFEVLRENVLRIWPDRPRSTSAAEGRCLKWLIQDLQERSTKTVTKSERRQFAISKFGVSRRAFDDRIWSEALRRAGREEASDPGRKRKSAH